MAVARKDPGGAVDIMVEVEVAAEEVVIGATVAAVLPIVEEADPQTDSRRRHNIQNQTSLARVRENRIPHWHSLSRLESHLL